MYTVPPVDAVAQKSPRASRTTAPTVSQSRSKFQKRRPVPPSHGAASSANVLSGDDLAASLDGVSESLKRATAYINTARAYFKNAPPPGPDAPAEAEN